MLCVCDADPLRRVEYISNKNDLYLNSIKIPEIGYFHPMNASFVLWGWSLNEWGAWQ